MKSYRFSSIQFKIISLIVLVLLSAGVFIVYFINSTQSSNLISAMNRGILLTALKNMMLDGRAPLLVRTISDLQDLNEYKSIAIYHTNGIMAFSDFQTLDYVNSNQKGISFEKTPRLTDNHTSNEKKNILSDISDALDRQVFKQEFYSGTKELEYYYPIENQAECMNAMEAVILTGD